MCVVYYIITYVDNIQVILKLVLVQNQDMGGKTKIKIFKIRDGSILPTILSIKMISKLKGRTIYYIMNFLLKLKCILLPFILLVCYILGSMILLKLGTD